MKLSFIRNEILMNLNNDINRFEIFNYKEKKVSNQRNKVEAHSVNLDGFFPLKVPVILCSHHLGNKLNVVICIHFFVVSICILVIFAFLDLYGFHVSRRSFLDGLNRFKLAANAW